MSELNICRKQEIELIFCQQGSAHKIKDHCQFVLGITGPVDAESGMIINLVDIDKILSAYISKFARTEVKDIFSFLQRSRQFLEDALIEYRISVNILNIQCAFGEIEWKAPWRDYDLRFTQIRKILISDVTNLDLAKKNMSSALFNQEIKKLIVRFRGTSIDIFRKTSKKDFRRLWSAWSEPELLKQEMMKSKSLSGFGVYDNKASVYRICELSLREFSAKAFQKTLLKKHR